MSDRLVGFRCIECPDPKPFFSSESEAWAHIASRHRAFVFEEHMQWAVVEAQP